MNTPPLIVSDPHAEQARLVEAERLDRLADAVLDLMERGGASPQMIERWLRCRAKAANMRGQRYNPEDAAKELVDRGLCRP